LVAGDVSDVQSRLRIFLTFLAGLWGGRRRAGITYPGS
jgi:hypothetical protein